MQTEYKNFDEGGHKTQPAPSARSKLTRELAFWTRKKVRL